MRSRLFSTLPSALAVCLVAAAAGYLVLHPPKQAMPVGRAPTTATPLAAQAPASVAVPPGGPSTPPAASSAASPSIPATTPASGASAPMAGAAAQQPGQGNGVQNPAAKKPPAGAEFRVQAGAFQHREYADDLAHRLRARGYSVTVVGGPMIRVWVGSPTDHAAAERLAANLRANGFAALVGPAR